MKRIALNLLIDFLAASCFIGRIFLAKTWFIPGGSRNSPLLQVVSGMETGRMNPDVPINFPNGR